MQCDCDYVIYDRDDLPLHYDNCSSTWEEMYPGKRSTKNKDGSIRLPNDHLRSLDVDILYHLGLDTHNYDLPKMFGDIKFVCMGGTKYRMRELAEYMIGVLGLENKNVNLVNLTKHSQRYDMYKVGPVLTVSHGIGIPSMTILLQEVIKLLYYAKAKNPMIIRVGTSGGLGVPPGSVVVSKWGLNATLEKTYDIPILGTIRKLPSLLDRRVSQEMHSMATDDDGFKTYLGVTMAADDFYRSQGRLDGPFCDYTESDKNEYLKKLSKLGVRNVEMEATAFSALTREAGIRAGIVCVTFLDRWLGDQVTPSKATLKEWQRRPMTIVGRYIAKYMEKEKSSVKNGK